MSAISDFSTSNPVSSTDDAFNSLSSAEFLQIIFTELQNQDPLEPQDTNAMLNQLSALRSIESDQNMVDSLENLVSQNEFAAASQLIGSLVSGISLDNQRVADLVISVSQSSQGPVLNLFDGSRMLFDQVDEIAGPLDDYVPDEPSDDDDDTPTDDPKTGVVAPTPTWGETGNLDITPGTRDTPSTDPLGIIVSPG